MNTLPLRESAFAALPEGFYARVRPEPLGGVHWVAQNHDLAAEIGLPEGFFDRSGVLAALGGSAADYRPQPLASVYGGHQFGVYVPQLGDGRAVLLGASDAPDGRVWEWQLKGAGKTPFSRFADGRAVLRSSIREYLASEAVHGLGIPTTRALALVGSPDAVYRERQETVAVLTRLAPCFIRFGHLEYFARRGREAQLRALLDFLLAHYFPAAAAAPQPDSALFDAMVQNSAELAAAWQSVGFCHGVLNTDNLSVLGLTIDYGPFGFLDAYDKHHVPNRSDREGRYAYGAQPYIVQWNLSRAGAAFLPFCAADDLRAVLEDFPRRFQTAYEARMRAKLGLRTADAGDGQLIEDLFAALQGRGVDFTLFFRRLSVLDSRHGAPLPPDLAALLPTEPLPRLDNWFGRYRRRLRMEGVPQAEKTAQMNRANPLYILRNYLLEQAIAQAQNGDFGEIGRLHRCLSAPFEERAGFADLAAPAPAWAAGICITCSS
ncbi:YdiU family protein [Neisseria leonii]|uniref:Protein nucleotidyltransferase YdiU n=1 Tax=Neisseria leonii TaxID=2995413 RepID=A0A9X4IEA2_9NEIS|nr:YdiU family protein [Neisseria sp. 51.81]MDD9327958.1 YdiU family protein [Neisseria sp. 51.81]